MAAVKIPPAIPPKSPRATLVILGLVALALFLGLLRLGTWQVERLAWKRDLISRSTRAPMPRPCPRRKRQNGRR